MISQLTYTFQRLSKNRQNIIVNGQHQQQFRFWINFGFILEYYHESHNLSKYQNSLNKK